MDGKKYDWTRKSTTGREIVRLDGEKNAWTGNSTTGGKIVQLERK